jgi:hypothetical protein
VSRLAWVVLAGVLGFGLPACGSDPTWGGVSPVAETEWRCFAADPKREVNPAGEVLYYKQRLSAAGLEIAAVDVTLDKRTSATALYPRIGDHLEQHAGAWPPGRVTLLLPDATHWTRSVFPRTDGRSAVVVETRLDGVGMTTKQLRVDTTPPAMMTLDRYLATPCSVVDAALAKYPAER